MQAGLEHVFHDAAKRITALLPNGTMSVLDGQDHGAPAHIVAPVVVWGTGNAIPPWPEPA